MPVPVWAIHYSTTGLYFPWNHTGSSAYAYVFDGTAAAANLDPAAYLLHDDWRLPDGDGGPGFQPAAPVNTVAAKSSDHSHLYIVDLDDAEGNLRFHADISIRLPGSNLLTMMLDLIDFSPEAFISQPWRSLRNAVVPILQGLGRDSQERAFIALLLSSPGDRGPWDVYSDWLQERGDPPSGLYLLKQLLTAFPRHHFPPHRRGSGSAVHVGEHIAQLLLHEVDVYHPQDARDIYRQWIFFDDRWASAHPHLANSLLRYATRWDVLAGE